MTPEEIEKAWNELYRCFTNGIEEATYNNRNDLADFIRERLPKVANLRREMELQSNILNMIRNAGIDTDRYRKFAEDDMKGGDVG